MAANEILRGRAGFPIYGRNGTLLYGTAVAATVSITVSWVDGDDLDLCAFFSHRSGAKVGYSYGSEIANTGDGFSATWGGDNTQGGPETINLAYSGASGIAGRRFEIHLNWYNTGDGHSGGPATVTATDASGATLEYTLTPASTKHKAANEGNPGVALVLNYDGSLRGIEAA